MRCGSAVRCINSETRSACALIRRGRRRDAVSIVHSEWNGLLEEKSLTEVEEEGGEKESDAGMLVCSWRKRARNVELIERENNFCE